MKQRKIDEQRRGTALVLALVTVVVIGVLAASVLEVSSSVTSRQAHAVDTKRSFYMAEAGLAEAYAGMMIGHTGNVGSQASPAAFGQGLFWVEAESPEPGLVVLESTGLAGGGRATLSMVVEKGGESVASLGIFSEDPLVVPPGTRIDRYDSREGTYDEQLGDPDGLEPVEVGSNEDVIVVSLPLLPTEIHGSATPGEAGTVTLGGAPLITGSTAPREENAVLPQVLVPSITQEAGVTHNSATRLTLPAGERHLASLTLGTNAEVVVEGPATVVVGTLNLNPRSELEFDTTAGAVDLYVTGDLILESGSVLSSTGVDPTQVTIQVDGEGTVTLYATSEFFGSLYAPETTVETDPAFEVFGALIAKQLVLGWGSRIHFDHRLAVEGARSTLPEQVSWRIVEFTPIGSTSDPMANLGLTGVTLSAPSLAHEDQTLTVKYYNRSGALLSYSGPESAFDWSQVKEVVSASRDGDSTAMMNTEGQNLIRF